MRVVPRHGFVDGCDVQPQQHAVPPDRVAYQRAMRELPREQQLHVAAADLYRLPLDAV